MLTSEATPEMLRAWKRAYAQNRKLLAPDRKSGIEVDAYFREKYHPAPFACTAFRDAVQANIVEDDFCRAKLPPGAMPKIATYRLSDAVYVGIDLTTGYFHVESENTEEMARIYDDLFLYRGLDEADLENAFLVAQYTSLKPEG